MNREKEQLKKAIENYKQSIRGFKSMRFNNSQIDELIKGIKSGVDISKYADLNLDWLQMATIRFGLENKIDMFKYANLEDEEKQEIHWHKITRRIPMKEEKEFYNYKNSDTILEGLPDYEEEVLVTNGKSVWVDSFNTTENCENELIYMSGTYENPKESYDEVEDIIAWAEIEAPNFDSLAESGAEGKTT